MIDIPVPGLDPDEPASPCLSVIVHPTLGRDSARFQQIVRYVEGLRDGLGQKQAARAAGTTPSAMRLQGKAVQKYLAKARSEYTATAEELRELTILQWAERALKDPQSPGYDPREAMAALHEISLIPEVGLKGTRTAGVVQAERQFNEEEQDILDRVDAVEGGEA